jgi:hypothetical protein
VAAVNKSARSLLLMVSLLTVGGGSVGAALSRRDRWGDGGDLVMDFWSSSSSASRQRLLQRWWEDGGLCAGAATVGLLWLAVVRWISWLVLGLRLVEGRSGADLRRRRRGAPDLEVEDELGAGPRPASHSDMWAPLVLLLSRFTKPSIGDGAASSSASLVSVSPSLGARFAGAGVGRRVRSGGADFPKDFFVVSSFERGFSAMCTGLRVPLDRSVLCVRVLYSGLSMT